MATFQQRRDPLRLMWRRVGAFALLVLVAIAARGVWGVYQKEKSSHQLRVEAEATLSDLQNREQKLRADIASLKSSRGLEAELRERYDLAKDGEGVVVIVDPPSAPEEPEPTKFQKIRSWFSW